jgi:anti-anti-sigma factor
MNDFNHELKGPGQLVLCGEMTIFAAATMKTVLLEQLAASDALEVDLAGVTEIDTSGIQVLLLLQREAARQRKALKLHSHSRAVSQALDLLTLGATLGQPVSIVWN